MHDDTQVARVHQMTQSLQDGMFPVRWVQDLGYGYGYPIFNFYAPFPYYFGSMFAIVTDVLLATKIAFIAAIVLSGIAMYLFMSAFFSRLSALVAAVVYIYFPYHAVNIYIRGNLNEVFAYAFLPLVLLGFFKLYYLKKTAPIQNRINWIILTAISSALVITSHNLTALMLGLILFLLTFILLFFSNHKKYFLISVISTGVLTIGASAFYWIPALLEMQYTNVLSQVGGTADFRDHFICVSQLWNSNWGFGGSGPGCIDGMSFKLGKINIVAALGAFVLFIFLLFKQKKQNFVLLQVVLYGLLIFSVFMSTQYSAIIWNIIPGLEFLQFPWRFLNFVALCISAVIGLFVYYISSTRNKYITSIVAFVLIASTLVLHAKLFVPQTYYSNQDEAYYSKKENIQYKASSLTDEYLPKGFIKPQSEDELPKNRLEVVQGQAEVNEVISRTGYFSALIDASTKVQIHLNIAYFPAWTLFINGEEAEYDTTNKGIQFSLSPGQSDIAMQFIQTPIQKSANVISLITLVSIVGVYIRFKNYGKKE